MPEQRWAGGLKELKAMETSTKKLLLNMLVSVQQ